MLVETPPEFAFHDKRDAPFAAKNAFGESAGGDGFPTRVALRGFDGGLNLLADEAAESSASAAFSFPADTTAGGGDGDPIAALAALAREIGSRDRATIDVRFGRTSGPLAVAVCEAVAVLAGASRAARRAFAREEGVVAAFRSVVSGADQRVAAAAAAAAASLGAG